MALANRSEMPKAPKFSDGFKFGDKVWHPKLEEEGVSYGYLLREYRRRAVIGLDCDVARDLTTDDVNLTVRREVVVTVKEIRHYPERVLVLISKHMHSNSIEDFEVKKKVLVAALEAFGFQIHEHRDD